MALQIDRLVDVLNEGSVRQHELSEMLAQLEKDAAKTDVGLALLFRLILNSVTGAQGKTEAALAIARHLAAEMPRQAP